MMGYAWVKTLIDEDRTEMVFPKLAQARMAATTLVGKGKAFSVEPTDDGWRFVVEEENERGGLAGRWSDE